GFLDRRRHFARFAVTEANLASAIPDHRQGSEAELTTAFDNLGHSVDCYQLLSKPVAANLARCHERNPCLELKAGFTCGISQCLHTTVVLVAGTVEGDLLDSDRLGPLRDQTTDHGSGYLVARRANTRTDLLLYRRGGSQRAATAGGDDLRIDVPRRTEHRQPVVAQSCDFRSRPTGATQACLLFVHNSRPVAYFFLASFSTIRSPAYRMPLPL